MNRRKGLRLNRRELLQWGGAALLGSTAGLRPSTAYGDTIKPCPSPDPLGILQSACAGGDAIEVYPTSPFILYPFTDPLPIPAPLKPVSKADVDLWTYPPGPGVGRQASDRSMRSTHQIWPSELPIVYNIKLQLAEHKFTTSKVLPIDASGRSIVAPNGAVGPTYLPASTIFGFNGTFPGPMIYGRYGQPEVVRFENQLDQNPYNLDVGDFGSPNRQFLTHLHNGHTAPESDGNPHFRFEGYHPGEWVDNLYLNMPAGNDDREKQSFLWFHDHFEGFTGANVYKGLVGLHPIYDPKLDPGDERYGLRLPGVPNLETGRVDYDIPLAVYDCALDDGVTPHKDFHNGCGETHPEWWGKSFFRHFPNHGFVGDVFTINGVASPVLEVKRRKYRFRFLDASIARVYEFKLMASTGGPQPAPGTAGQYQLPDGQQCMRFTQIASEGGLLPFPIVRNSFELWPAKRREFVVDFTKYQDGTPTKKGDVLYLVNVMEMQDGRKPEGDSNFRVPMMKIVIGDLPAVPDYSQIPPVLRPLPDVITSGVPRRTFELQRGGVSGGDPLAKETEWLINDQPFQLCVPLASPERGSAEIWTVKNGGGGWVHPMHFHQEEHQILSRNGVPTPKTAPGPNSPEIDDFGKEDTVALGPGDSLVLFRRFRTFTGPYVAHCHNLAHEDHNMMFGWSIVDT
jgi:FtsP/CotA-like multicopper oxidase with cupredoxin domain